MGILRPATPGFLVTLVATVLLAIVVFCVPYFKSVYFLKAAVNQNGVSGTLTLGTLGYCLNLQGDTTCSSPTVGYEFDPNKLLGNDLPVQIPQVVVKWVTYALVLHIVALGLAAISAFFGLLAHVREMSMACFSSCVSGFAAAIALIAFIFDIVFFFLVKARINNVQGGSATIGNAIWLTLAAWLLLFFSGCFFAIGRCCLGGSSRFPRGKKKKHDEENHKTEASGMYGNGGAGGGYNNNSYNQSSYAETMRLEAVKAEADRKARAASKPREQGLPAFEEFERTPLRSEPQYAEFEEERYAPYSPTRQTSAGPPAAAAGYGQTPQRYPGGYAGGAPGARAVDNMYSTAPAATAANVAPHASYPVGAAVTSGSNAYPNVASPPAPVRSQSYEVGEVFGVAAAGAAAGAGLAANRQRSEHERQQSYGHQNVPPQTSYNDPYAPQQNVYDPYGQNNQNAYGAQRQYSGYEGAYLGANQHGTTPSPYGMPSSGIPTGASYVTADDHTPVPGIGQPRPHSGYFGANDVDRYATQSPPAMDTQYDSARQQTLSAVEPGAAYGATAVSTPQPPRQDSKYPQHLAPSPQSTMPSRYSDWNPLGGAQPAPTSPHHDVSQSHEARSNSDEAPPPEYNPYEPGPSTGGGAGGVSLASGGPPRPEKRS